MVETKVVNCKKKVFAKGKEIYVQNSKNSDVRVYSLLGNIIANKKADSNMFNITMPASGVYLVKVGMECWKIVVE